MVAVDRSTRKRQFSRGADVGAVPKEEGTRSLLTAQKEKDSLVEELTSEAVPRRRGHGRC